MRIEVRWDTLQWHHNERDGVSYHRCLDYLLNRLLKRRSKKTSMLVVKSCLRCGMMGFETRQHFEDIGFPSVMKLNLSSVGHVEQEEGRHSADKKIKYSIFFFKILFPIISTEQSFSKWLFRSRKISRHFKALQFYVVIKFLLLR